MPGLCIVRMIYISDSRFLTGVESCRFSKEQAYWKPTSIIKMGKGSQVCHRRKTKPTRALKKNPSLFIRLPGKRTYSSEGQGVQVGVQGSIHQNGGFRSLFEVMEENILFEGNRMSL